MINNVHISDVQSGNADAAPGLRAGSSPKVCKEKLGIAMVVLHTSPAASPGAADAGGMNVVVMNTALALGRMGHRVDLLTRWNRPDDPYQLEMGPGVTLYNLQAGPPQTVAKSQSESLIEPFNTALGDWFAEHGAGIDVIHSHHWFSGVAALPIARQQQLPHLQSYHSVAAPLGAELAEGEQPESAGRPAGEALAARESDCIVAVSQAEKNQIIDRYGPDPNRLVVVRPGVDLEVFRPLSADEECWADECYLFFAARLQPLKAPDLAIRLLAEINPERRPKLLIAGEASADFASYAGELRVLAGELGVSEHVVYIGSQNRDQLAAMMRGACVLVNPSHSETYGLINLEASASGIPVVATRTGGMTESVVDGQTGVLLTSRDPKVWAETVQDFVGCSEKRAVFGAAGREFATTRSWDQVAKELIVVYQGQVF